MSQSSRTGHDDKVGGVSQFHTNSTFFLLMGSRNRTLLSVCDSSVPVVVYRPDTSESVNSSKVATTLANGLATVYSNVS